MTEMGWTPWKLEVNIRFIDGLGWLGLWEHWKKYRPARGKAGIGLHLDDSVGIFLPLAHDVYKGGYVNQPVLLCTAVCRMKLVRQNKL